MRNKLLAGILQNKHRIIYAVFVFVWTLTAFVTVLFGDDYYYAYFVKQGSGFFLSENVFHYLNTNGRALVHLLDELLLGFGMLPWRLFSVGMMAALPLLTARAASHAYSGEARQTEEYKKSLILSCALTGAFDIMMTRQAVWWATGSLNYLFPVVLLLLLWCLCDKYRLSEKKSRAYVFLPLLALAVGMSTEQAAFASLSVCLWFAVSPLFDRKKPKKLFIFCFFAALIGFLTLYCAPGNAVRTTYYPEFYEKSIFRRVYDNIPPLLNEILGSGGMHTAVITLLCGFSVGAFAEKKRENGAKKTLLTVSGTFTASVALLYSLTLLSVGGIGKTPVGIPDFSVKARTCVYLAVLAALLTVLAWSVTDYVKKHDDGVIFLAGAFVLQAAMLISPEFGPRTVLISAALLTVPTVRRIARMEPKTAGIVCASSLLLSAISLGGYLPLTVSAGIVLAALIASLIVRRPEKAAPAALTLFCLTLTVMTFIGYARNLPYHRYNAEKTAQYAASEEKSGVLTLAKLPSDIYKYTMPYDDPYHLWRYKLLYDIPDGTELIFDYSNLNK